MPREIKPPRVVTIAGKEYTLHYNIDDRESIETELDKSVWEAITSGRIHDQVVLLRHGLAKKYPSLKDDAIRKRLQDHLDGGENIDVPIRGVFWAVIESGLAGGIVNIDKLRKMCPDPNLDAPTEDDGDGLGKGQAAAVPANRSGI
jgi:hypothetical protein